MSTTPLKSNSSSSKKWRPSASTEARRLGNNEGDWNLATGAASTTNLSRTRGRRSRLSLPQSLPQPRQLCNVDDDSTALSSLTDDASASSKHRRPPHTRVIIEVNPVTSMLEKYLRCPKCQAALAVTFPTTCLASGCRLKCQNEMDCDFVVVEAPIGSEVPLSDDAGSALITRNTDYALNVLYVIGFISSGDGGTEAARLLGLLGLPNSTTMQSRSFGNIEKQLSPVIQEYTDEIMMGNLCKEVASKLGDRVDDNGNRLYDRWVERNLPEELWPRVDGCADMGWQQKGSGRKRNSKSGHALIIGMETRKVIAKSLCSKGCGFCKTWYTRNSIDEAPPPHECFINHEGSSGCMEPKAVLQMYVWLFEQCVIVERFVADDDSSIKAKMKWSNADHKLNHNTTSAPRIVNSKGNVVTRPDYGALPRHMPEPGFVADPNHRRKTLASALYALAALGKTSPDEQQKQHEKRLEAQKKAAENNNKKPTKKVDTNKTWTPRPWNCTMTKMDCRRLSKNFAFMARTLQYKATDAEIVDAGKAVVEHHFDNHQHCGDWCRRKLQLNNATGNNTAAKFYRDKVKDSELYERLLSIMGRFLTLEALKEVAHNMDTCANESFNNTIAWLAPKNKVYCGTNSLANRISIALGISTLGTLVYFEGLLQKMGINVSDDVHHFLKVKATNRQKRLDKTKTRDYKNKRKADEFEKIKKESSEATTARAKRDGVYEPGIGMAGGYVEDDDAKPPAAVTNTTNDVSKRACRSCGGLDHQRATSKRCRLYVARKKKKKNNIETGAPANEEAKLMEEELDQLDSLPFVNSDGDDDASDAFFSATSEFS